MIESLSIDMYFKCTAAACVHGRRLVDSRGPLRSNHRARIAAYARICWSSGKSNGGAWYLVPVRSVPLAMSLSVL